MALFGFNKWSPICLLSMQLDAPRLALDVLAILIVPIIVNDIRSRRGNACVRTCKTKTKIESKLKRQRKRYLKLKKTLQAVACSVF